MGKYRKIQPGDKFGRLTVISKTDIRSGPYVVWECLCVCGKTTKVRTGNLINRHSSSCGCYKAECSVKKQEALRRIENTALTLVERNTLYKNNSTGVRGVSKEGDLYRARIQFNGKIRNLGKYKSIEEAARVRKAAEDDNQEELMRLQELYKITKGV